MLCASVQAEVKRTVYMNDAIAPKLYGSGQSYNRNEFSRYGNDYRSTYGTFTRDGDTIHSSAGHGNTYKIYNDDKVYDTSTGTTYQKTGSIWEPIF